MTAYHTMDLIYEILEVGSTVSNHTGICGLCVGSPTLWWGGVSRLIIGDRVL